MTETSKYGRNEQAQDLQRLNRAHLDANSVRILVTGKDVSATMGMNEIISYTSRSDGARSFWEDIAIGLEKQAEDQVAIQEHVSKLGWFISVRISAADIASLATFLEAGLESNIESFFLDHVSSDATDVFARLYELFPTRQHILEEAFEAHSDGRYYTSIPAMLAQTDGIVRDELGHLLFVGGGPRKRRQLQRKRAVLLESRLREQGARGLAREMFMVAVRQLDLENALFASEDNDLEETVISRHLVLHGTDTTYGTESNSLRCIQLLDFLADLAVILGGPRTS